MSRHFFDTVSEGRPVRVTIGYDRPTDSFFMLIEARPGPDTYIGRWPYLYASAADLEDRPDDLAYYQTKLAARRIAIPPGLLGAVEADAADRIGNYAVEHFADGSIHEHFPRPLAPRPYSRR